MTVCLSALCALAYACVVSEEASIEQAEQQHNGSSINGMYLNGSSINGMNLVGFQVEEAQKGGSDLTNLRVVKGELVAEQNSVTLQGAQLAGAQLKALARSPGAPPASSVVVTYRIASVTPEVGNDPTNSGSTFLYMLEQWDATNNLWVPACAAAPDGDRNAIPLAAEWDEYGNRTDDSSLFTLACTSGVIAKCYRWGYRPWVTNYGDLATMHWTCTRLARADYCGNGSPNTYDGHLIDVWDTLPSPGPIQSPATPMGTFDAAWNTGGATCLSDATRTAYGSAIGSACSTRVFPTCNSAQDALNLDSTVKMFRAVY